MPCSVPYCDPEGQSFTLKFPRSHYLFERWQKAIELGSGSLLPVGVDPLLMEICQQHFEEVDQYSEPVIFRNQNMGRKIHLACCRLCLEFNYSEHVTSACGEQMIGGVSIEELLKTLFNIQLDDSRSLDCICNCCLVRLDLVVNIRKQFTIIAKHWRKMDIFINEENRLRYKKQEAPKVAQHRMIVKSIDEKKLSTLNEVPTAQDLFLDVKVEVEPDLVAIASNDDDAINDTVLNDEYLKIAPEHDNSAMLEQKGRLKRKNSNLRKKSQNSTEKRRVGRPRNKSVTGSKRKISLKGITERKCYMCVQLFETAEELFSHMVAHIDQILTCEVCKESFSNLTKYNRHLAKHDPIERPNKCDHCELRFTDNLGKRRHEKQRHQVDHSVTLFTGPQKRKGKFTCQHCGKQCQSLAFLKEHEDGHAGIKRHECRSCGRLFANKNNLERHHLIHTSEKPYKCNICGKAFRQSPMYKDHLRLHSGETPYDCSGCDMQFSSTTLLRKHKIRFHGNFISSTTGSLSSVRPHNSCRFCLNSFKRHSLLIDHIQQNHSQEEIEYFSCPTCEQRFVVKQAFESHLRNHDKNFQCDFCDKSFSTLQALKFHQPIHDEGRGYTCKTCSKSFTHISNLKRHELLHLGIKRYECDFCGKRFAQSNQLHTHRRTHTGEKPYECQKCGKRFADNSTLCKHRKSVCKSV
ncbi:zinc finger protein ZFP2-like [Wyeomyia smithii]|uniref:zinc finger protein ZFP2-like n=1 Tax=Wyeomyia smithii TaxID=174621 RepID=UPI002467CA35|nr:zinc finger protein ZFP2-like [Wyeomyia smithii]